MWSYHGHVCVTGYHSLFLVQQLIQCVQEQAETLVTKVVHPAMVKNTERPHADTQNTTELDKYLVNIHITQLDYCTEC